MRKLQAFILFQILLCSAQTLAIPMKRFLPVCLLVSPVVHGEKLLDRFCGQALSEKIFRKDDKGYIVFWEIVEHPELYREISDEDRLEEFNSSYSDYRKFAKSVSAEPEKTLSCLFSQLSMAQVACRVPIFDKCACSTMTMSIIESVLEQKMGRLRKINCLEATLFSQFNALVDLSKNPMEMVAFVFKKNNKIAIMAGLLFQNVSGRVIADPMIAGALNVTAEAGWKPFIHFHNHPESNDRRIFDWCRGAGLAPSGTDLRTYLKNTFEQYVITNGLDTFALQDGEIPEDLKEIIWADPECAQGSKGPLLNSLSFVFDLICVGFLVYVFVSNCL